MKKLLEKYGYFHLKISPSIGTNIIKTNSERAFVVSQFQDLLSPRITIEQFPMHHHLSSCIDLLAFSLLEQGIECVVFSIDPLIATLFASTIAENLHAYQIEYLGKNAAVSPPGTVSLQRIVHEDTVLALTAALHANHRDWEYNRYSSIGFYLNDRRGDWMRLWRMTRLYNNNPSTYRKIVERYVTQAGFGSSFTPHPYPLVA